MLSRLKTFAALCGAFFVAVAIAFLRGRAASIHRMEQEQAKRRLDAVHQRKELDDEVDQMGAADLDSNYARWLRDDDR